MTGITLAKVYLLLWFQGNIEQSIKWLPSEKQNIKNKYLNLTNQVMGNRVIIWPEAAIPDIANNEKNLYRSY